ncbi:MAG: ABC transporter permease [Mesorhizobium sp.]|nr:MAG: ABC transporter permease [Mesorhizobium sp.]TIL30715.1 MAG: ABC transporter permease [Mesorhizobium sp.]TIL51479.1 MAG: ABC transporter permease [Mesorhizobium sp.]TIL85554.1 MAG: ABC transporter permease [Mesorhizobium sp.]
MHDARRVRCARGRRAAFASIVCRQLVRGRILAKNRGSSVLMNAQQTTIITPRRGWFDLDFWHLWRYRDLLLLFAMRDIKVRYKQTLLGPAWLILQPLALTAALTTVISGIAGISTGGHPAPIFYLTALVLWSYFSQVVSTASQVFIANGHLFSKIYFPRLVVPVSSLLSNSVALAIQLGVALAFLLWYQLTGKVDGLSWRLAFFPLVIIQVAAFSLAVGLCLGASTAKYRDTAHMTPFLIQIWLFVTPIIFPFSAIPEQYRTLTGFLNPLAVIIDEWRWCFFGTSAVGAPQIAAALVTTSVVLFIGVVIFQRVERTAMDML